MEENIINQLLPLWLQITIALLIFEKKTKTLRYFIRNGVIVIKILGNLIIKNKVSKVFDLAHHPYFKIVMKPKNGLSTLALRVPVMHSLLSSIDCKVIIDLRTFDHLSSSNLFFISKTINVVIDKNLHKVQFLMNADQLKFFTEEKFAVALVKNPELYIQI